MYQFNSIQLIWLFGHISPVQKINTNTNTIIKIVQNEQKLTCLLSDVMAEMVLQCNVSHIAVS